MKNKFIPLQEPQEPSYLPMNEEEQEPIVRPAVASERAAKYNVALGDNSPGYDTLFSSILNGSEKHEREQALGRHQVKMQEERMNLAQEFMSRREPGSFTKEDLDFVMGLTDTEVQQAQDDPTTFFETEYSKWLVNNHQGTNLAGASQENEAVAAGILDGAEYTLFQKETAQKWLEDLEARWESTGTGGKAWAYGETFLPFWTWSNLSGAAEKAPVSAFLPGDDLEQQYQYLLLLPKEQFVSEAKAAIDQIAESNLLDAMQFAQGLVSYSTSNKYLDNVLIGAGDLATFVPGAAGVSRMKLLAGSTKDLIQAAGTRSISKISLKTVAGDAPGAARDLAVKKIKSKAEASDVTGEAKGAANTFEDLAGEIDSIFNPQAALGLDKDTGTFTREAVQRMLVQMETNSAEMLRTVVDPLNPGRLTDEQLEAAMKNAESVVKEQYPQLNDSVMRVQPVNKADTLVDVDTLSVQIGTKNAQPFKSMASAHNVAKNIYKIRDNYKVRQFGDGQFFIEVEKKIDETSPSIRDIPVINTKHETPKTLLNTFLGVLRTPDDLLSPETMKGFKATAYGASGYIRRLREIAKPIGKLKDKESFVKFLEYQRDFVNGKGERGRFSNTLGDFERDWLKSIGRTPTEQEALAYETFKQLNDYNYLVYNLDLLRDKYRQGIETFVIPWTEAPQPLRGSQTNPITAKDVMALDKPRPANTRRLEGKYLKDGIDWSNQENAGIWIFDHGNPSSKRYFNKKFTNREKFNEELKGEKYHVIQLTPEGQRSLKDEPNLGKVLPKGPIDFLVVKDYQTKPLNWKQIPYRAGGRVEFPDGWFVRQPQLTRIEQGGEVFEHRYDGDVNVLNFRTESEARRFADKVETARKMLNDVLLQGNKRSYAADLVQYLDENLPWTFDEFYNLFKVQGNPKGFLDLDTPIYATAKGRSVNDTYKLDQQYRNIRDSRQSSYNLYNTVNLQYALERDAPIYSVAKKGDTNNPLYDLKPAQLIDPLSTLNRSVSQLMRGRYLENVKFKLSEQFINEFGDLMKASKEELRTNPMKFLLSPEFKDNVSDRAKLAAAKNFRRTAINFFGLRNEFQESVRYTKQKLADYIFEKGGEKSFSLVEPYLLSTTKDPISFFRSVAFHTHLGLFNPVQMFLQAQTITHIAGVEGLPRAYKSVAAATFMRRLVFNDSPEMVRAAAKRAKVFGWNEDEFIESFEALKQSGMWNVGGEVAMRDDFFDPNIVQSLGSRVLEKGTMFFSEGERMTRLTAWNAAYRRWRKANPGKVFGNDQKLEVLNRADLLNVNMSSASNAAWGRGFASIPTQFLNYQARLAEQFLGKRLTVGEKSQALLTYSAIYGVPVATGVPFAIWPFFEDIRQELLERGIQYDDNLVSQTLVDGMASMMIEYATGEKFNFGSRYGPGGLSFLKDVLKGEKGVVETLLGVSGTSMGNLYSTAEPFTMSLIQTLSGNDEYFPILLSDMEEFASNVSSVNGIRKMYYAMHLGKYISKNEVAIDDVSGLEGMIMGLTGLSPQRVEDTFIKLESNKELADLQKEEKKEAIKWYRKAFRATTDDEMAAYFRQAKLHLVAGGFTDTQIVSIFRDATKSHETLLMGIGADFAERSPERLKAWHDTITKRNRE